MLGTIKTLLGLTDDTQDSLINALIQNAINEVLNYCHINAFPEELETAVEQMVVYAYNRLETEGSLSTTYSNFSITYAQDYPEAILRQLRPYRRVIFK